MNWYGGWVVTLTVYSRAPIQCQGESSSSSLLLSESVVAGGPESRSPSEKKYETQPVKRKEQKQQQVQEARRGTNDDVIATRWKWKRKLNKALVIVPCWLVGWLSVWLAGLALPLSCHHQLPWSLLVNGLVSLSAVVINLDKIGGYENGHLWCTLIWAR